MARAKISGTVKKQVTDLAQGCCEYCKSQIRFSPNSFEIGKVALFVLKRDQLPQSCLTYGYCIVDKPKPNFLTDSFHLDSWE